jgi:hypothetical protein
MSEFWDSSSSTRLTVMRIPRPTGFAPRAGRYRDFAELASDLVVSAETAEIRSGRAV